MPKGKSYITRADYQKQIRQLQMKLAKVQVQSKSTKPAKSADTDDVADVQARKDEGVANLVPDIDPSTWLQAASSGKGHAMPKNVIRETPVNGAVVIKPTNYVRGLFSQHRRGLGGFQTLHRALADKMGGTLDPLVLSPSDFAKIVNYSTHYGDGGFQQSLRWLVALWVSENLPEIYRRTV